MAYGLKLGEKDIWGPRLGPGWKGKKFLGAGVGGEVGLWSEYEGSPAKAPAVRQVAVKQMYDSGYGKIPFEVQLMENLTNAKSKHIVKMYKYVRRARLQDEIGNSYIGMYMEYCPGGVLGSLMGGDANLTPILEVDLWGIFLCLASALLVLETGSEENAEPLSDKLSLVHYDLKLDNVLLGNRDRQHPRYPIAKMGDFGLSIFEDTTVSERKLAEIRGTGFPGWRAPENESGRDMKHPRKGSCTNVFQVGSLMHTLIQRKNMNPADKDISSWDAPFTRKEYAGTYTKGAELFDEPWNKLYSKELRELVMECMMFEPTDRPSVLGLRNMVSAAYGFILEVRVDEGMFDNGKNPPVKDFSHIPFEDGEWLEDLGFADVVVQEESQADRNKYLRV